jgi:hypothetical protein
MAFEMRCQSDLAGLFSICVGGLIGSGYDTHLGRRDSSFPQRMVTRKFAIRFNGRVSDSFLCVGLFHLPLARSRTSEWQL